ncbi:hypothetical protein ACJJTC_018415 [Scirpophaga incertulas]
MNVQTTGYWNSANDSRNCGIVWKWIKTIVRPSFTLTLVATKTQKRLSKNKSRNVVKLKNRICSDSQEFVIKITELEARASEPGRYHSRGGQLLREEKEWEELCSNLPKIEAQIRDLVKVYEKQTGQASPRNRTVAGLPATYDRNRPPFKRQLITGSATIAMSSVSSSALSAARRTAVTAVKRPISGRLAARLVAEVNGELLKRKLDYNREQYKIPKILISRSSTQNPRNGTCNILIAPPSRKKNASDTPKTTSKSPTVLTPNIEKENIHKHIPLTSKNNIISSPSTVKINNGFATSRTPLSNLQIKNSPELAGSKSRANIARVKKLPAII